MYGVQKSFCFVAKTLMMLGNDVMPNLTSTRIAFASVICTSVMLYYYWEASIISYVAVKKITLPIKTLDEFTYSRKFTKNYKVNIYYMSFDLVLSIRKLNYQK